MFWNNTPFPSSSYFRKVFQKPPHAVRNVLYHHSPNSTFLVGRFEQQTPTAGTPAGWKRAAGGTRTWTRWESMWCTGEGRELLEQCGKKESTEVKGIQVQMLTGGSAAPFAGWSQTCGSHLALLRPWAAAMWWCGWHDPRRTLSHGCLSELPNLGLEKKEGVMLSVWCLPENLHVGGIYRHTHIHRQGRYTQEILYIHIHIYIAYMQYI